MSLRPLWLLVFALALAGCAGRAAALPATGTLPRRATTALLTITVPAPGSKGSRAPRYVSSASRSIAISVNGDAPVVADLIPGAPNCTSDAAGLHCVVTVPAPPGEDVFEATIFDGLQGAGTALSHARIPQTVAAGSDNVLGITLHGIVATLDAVLAADPVTGTPSSIPVTLVARDASGAVIAGDPFDTPLQLVTNAAAGSVTLSPATVRSPSDAVRAGYDGSPLKNATIAANGIPTATRAAAVHPHTGTTGDWSTWGYDAQRTGENPNERALDAAAVAHLRELWSTPASGVNHDTQPLVAADIFVPQYANGGAYADLVIVGGEHGLLQALDARDGMLVWQHQLAAASTTCADMPDGVFGITGTPVLDRGRARVYAVDGAGALHALMLADGTEAPGWPPQGIALGFDPQREHVYGAALFDAAADRLILATAGYCDVPPYRGESYVRRAADGAAVAAFATLPSGSNGAGIWGAGGAALDPSVPGRYYVATGNAVESESTPNSDAILALDELSAVATAAAQPDPASGGDLDFGASTSLFTPPGCPPLLATQRKSGTVYLYDRTGALAPVATLPLGTSNSAGLNLSTPSFSRATGMMYETMGTFAQPYNAGPGIVAVAFDAPCTPRVVWRTREGAPGPRSSATIANGVVYYVNGAGSQLFALDARNGTLLATLSTHAPSFAPPAVSSGRVFVSGWGGRVTAFTAP